jgi:hypothetical protein
LKTLPLIAATLALTLPAAADAAHQIKYQISGGGHSATFVLDANPTPMIVDDGFDFAVTTDDSSFDGVANLAGITFYLDPFEGPADVPGGGLTYLDNTSFFSFDIAGMQLFRGPLNAPTLFAFAPETLPDLESGAMITISASDVPEPASWALMVTGFGLAGASMRRKVRLAIA